MDCVQPAAALGVASLLAGSRSFAKQPPQQAASIKAAAGCPQSKVDGIRSLGQSLFITGSN